VWYRNAAVPDRMPGPVSAVLDADETSSSLQPPASIPAAFCFGGPVAYPGAREAYACLSDAAGPPLIFLPPTTRALFRCEKILDFATVVFSFVCGKYYSIIN
jgi:hypothetical protein